MIYKDCPSKGREVIILASGNQHVQATGKLLYDEKAHAWNKLKVKSEVLKECPSFPDKTGSIPYTMIVPKDYKEFKEALKKIPKDTIPILLYIFKEKKHGSR